jgi:hypothetical protein
VESKPAHGKMRLLELLLFICLLLVTPPQVCGFLPANRRATTASPRSFVPVRTTSFVRRDEACPSWLATSTSAEGCLENPDNEPRRIRHNHILARGYRKYLDLCVTRPWPTKAVSGGVVAGLGAILSQGMAAAGAGVPLTINWHQLQSFALAGLLFEGPYMHWWYEQLWRMGRWLEAQKGIQALNSRFLTMAQILVDQTIGVAIFFPAYFYAYEIAQSMVLLRGEYNRSAAIFGSS